VLDDEEIQPAKFHICPSKTSAITERKPKIIALDVKCTGCGEEWRAADHGREEARATLEAASRETLECAWIRLHFSIQII
jgi:hypothetical protein